MFGMQQIYLGFLALLCRKPIRCVTEDWDVKVQESAPKNGFWVDGARPAEESRTKFCVSSFCRICLNQMLHVFDDLCESLRLDRSYSEAPLSVFMRIYTTMFLGLLGPFADLRSTVVGSLPRIVLITLALTPIFGNTVSD